MTGLKWKLRCARCEFIFEVEFFGEHRAYDATKGANCPKCSFRPADSREAVGHTVLGFIKII